VLKTLQIYTNEWRKTMKKILTVVLSLLFVGCFLTCFPNTHATAQAPSPVSEDQPIKMSEVITWSQNGVPDYVIIDKIIKSGSFYYISPSRKEYLLHVGVSERVIDFITKNRSLLPKNNTLDRSPATKNNTLNRLRGISVGTRIGTGSAHLYVDDDFDISNTTGTSFGLFIDIDLIVTHKFTLVSRTGLNNIEIPNRFSASFMPRLFMYASDRARGVKDAYLSVPVGVEVLGGTPAFHTGVLLGGSIHTSKNSTVFMETGWEMTYKDNYNNMKFFMNEFVIRAGIGLYF
jgi:hypothetical protein